MILKDQLSWKEFLKESSNNHIISKVKPFNRLIAHSENLFIIAGYGSFTKGYILIITKEFIPSFGLVNDNITNELNFLIRLFKNHLNKKYNRDSVIFEHGMCACVGGLDRAHLHVMSINKKSSEITLMKSIEKAIYQRKVGIEYIKYGKYKLQNIHDINQFMNNADYAESSKYEVKGKLLSLKDIKNLEVTKWPHITLNHINKGGHYVYFKSDFINSSFLTTQNFKTQFGRQIVYENELAVCDNFKAEINAIISKNPILETWKWQSCLFEENIIKTVNETRKSLKEYTVEFSSEYEEFKFKII